MVTGYSARVNPDAFGPMLSAFVAITPLDPSQPDDAPRGWNTSPKSRRAIRWPARESYVLFVRVASPPALEVLLQQIRTAANVRTRSTVILNTFYSHRVSLPK